MDKNASNASSTSSNASRQPFGQAPAPEKVDKKGAAVQKIEEENTKAEQTLKNAIDLLKQEIEK